MQTFVLAGGCFWCLDAAYRALRGVSKVVSGYVGGEAENPSYEAVCTGRTGHAEAVAVTFDPEVIPAEVILDAFFTMHDPRQLNHQGADTGTQYRSAMFPADDAQREAFEVARARASELWDAPLGDVEGTIVTTMEPLGAFWEAEDYHQDFFAKNPGQGYCLAVAVPKVNKVRARFAEYARA
ncbi:peptide-methionine (S)-S-oxide reductase MsrA [Microbacterium excoecariae]|uniref:peptide-methionine (S)-S-oxide reductase MsrA n=1 Tax=Microbacterium excoecariae TaxID=2715210 RepID=UPI00140BACF5|nr:peptide-methionine (S)-S-oxide reductase MsrA [Microbacterium excoecariae]NHI16935.1 peptide-methionine (S)-S-oxide reductase MsrA [Microbacterium excoecariae]